MRRARPRLSQGRSARAQSLDGCASRFGGIISGRPPPAAYFGIDSCLLQGTFEKYGRVCRIIVVAFLIISHAIVIVVIWSSSSHVFTAVCSRCCASYGFCVGQNFSKSGKLMYPSRTMSANLKTFTDSQLDVDGKHAYPAVCTVGRSEHSHSSRRRASLGNRVDSRPSRRLG